jgi:hypothetical protein
MADEAPVGGIRAGDEATFRVLAERSSKKLHAHVRRNLPGSGREVLMLIRERQLGMEEHLGIEGEVGRGRRKPTR